MIKLAAFIFLVLQVAFLMFLGATTLKDYLFGWAYTIIIILININFVFIRIYVIDNTIAPKNDPGITIWWLCCIKFGQKGSYSEKNKNNMIKRKLYELKNSNPN